MNKIKSIMASIKNHKKGIVAAGIVSAVTVIGAVALALTKKGDEPEDELLDAEVEEIDSVEDTEETE